MKKEIFGYKNPALSPDEVSFQSYIDLVPNGIFYVIEKNYYPNHFIQLKNLLVLENCNLI